MLSFQLLGSVSLHRNGQPLVQFRSQKEIALLIYLAQTGQSHSREFIADLLWDDRTMQQALSNLRTALARLRKQIGNELVISRQTLALTSESQQQVDSVNLLQTLQNVGKVNSHETAGILQTALNAYSGPFLADFTLSDASQFDTWAMTTRETIHRQVITTYDKLGQYALSTNDADYGIRVARRWLQVDALDEQAHTLLIRLLLQAGTVREAVAHYDSCSNLLHAELGIEPPSEMTALIRSVRAKPTPTPQAVANSRNNLPAIYDQFLGRKSIQHELHARLDQPWCRLVTIVGPGGVGKTRLATTIAHSRLNRYADGVWLVELAEVDPDDDNMIEAIAVEIATALDLRLSGSTTPVQQLLSFLQHKEMLLVLDNVEYLLAGTQLFMDMIQHCQKVQLLVTSREALRIRAEWAVTLTGLAFPTDDNTPTQSDAVDLFVARQSQQQGTRSADDQTAISAICRMVEGLPLAIELAAALTHGTTCQAIAHQLQNGFDALSATLRDVPKRHHSLRIVFEMSWRALTPVLQDRLARLALFRGGFTESAAQQIAQAHPHELRQLCEKSLLSYDTAQKRYTLHAVIRAYTAEKLTAPESTLQKHARYFLTLLARHVEPLQKSAPQQSITVIHPDIDNIRLAWQTGLAAPKADNPASVDLIPVDLLPVDLLLGALMPLSIYYQLRGLAREGEVVMHTTAQAAETWVKTGGMTGGMTGKEDGKAAGCALATRAGVERARFQNRLGQHRPAIETSKTVLKLATQCGDRWAIGMGHVMWGEALWRLGEYDLAQSKLTHALTIANTIANTLDSTLLIGWCHHHLGIIDDIQSRYNAAHDHLQQACAAWREIDRVQTLSNSLNSIGLICYHQGDLPGARQAMDQALAICIELDNRPLQGLLLNNLSMVSTDQGDYLSAQEYLQRSLELANANSDLATQGSIYTNLGKNYRLLGKTGLAIENLEQGVRISESIGNRILMATALFYLAETSREADSEHAESFYRQALGIARQYNLQHVECEVLIGIAEFLSKYKESEASQYSVQAVTLAETLQNPTFLARATAINDSISIAQM